MREICNINSFLPGDNTAPTHPDIHQGIESNIIIVLFMTPWFHHGMVSVPLTGASEFRLPAPLHGLYLALGEYWLLALLPWLIRHGWIQATGLTAMINLAWVNTGYQPYCIDLLGMDEYELLALLHWLTWHGWRRAAGLTALTYLAWVNTEYRLPALLHSLTWHGYWPYCVDLLGIYEYGLLALLHWLTWLVCSWGNRHCFNSRCCSLDRSGGCLCWSFSRSLSRSLSFNTSWFTFQARTCTHMHAHTHTHTHTHARTHARTHTQYYPRQRMY